MFTLIYCSIKKLFCQLVWSVVLQLKFPQWIANHKFIPIQVFIMQMVGFQNGILATTL